jgi:hypothetical protein
MIEKDKITVTLNSFKLEMLDYVSLLSSIIN